MKKIITNLILFALVMCSTQTAFAQFPEGFETAVPPTGWASFRGVNDEGTIYDWTSTTTSNTGSQAAFVRYENVANSAEDWLVTPQYTPTATSSTLTFSQRQGFTSSFGSVYTIRVSTLSQTTHADFTIVDTQVEADFNVTSYQEHTVDLSAYVGQAIYVAFVMENDDGDSWYIDNVDFPDSSLPPSCTMLSSPSDMSTDVDIDADLNWSVPSGTPTGYKLQIGTTSGGDEFLAAGTDVGDVTTYEQGTMAYSTTYYVLITPYNDNGDAMGCMEESFTTAADPTLMPPFCQGFDTYVPTNWTEAAGAIGDPTTFSSTTSSSWTSDGFANAGSTGSARIEIWSTTTDEWLMTPPIDLGDGSIDYNLDFDLAMTVWNTTDATTLGVDDLFAVVISTDDGATWSSTNILQSWDNTTPISNTGEAVSISLAAYSGIVRIGFYGYSDTSNEDNNVYIDNVCVNNPAAGPSCTMLTSPTDGATEVDPDSDISWNPAAGMPTGYLVNIGTTPGGVEVAEMEDVGLMTTYEPGTLPANSMIYVTIIPYNGIGNAMGCMEESFMTDCLAAEGTLSIDASDCANDMYSIVVNLTSIGSATGLDITTSDPNASTITGAGIGMHVLTGFTGTSGEVTITLTPDPEEPNCVLTALATIPSGCPPANDLCANPETVTVDVNCGPNVTGNNTNATDSGEPASSCAGSNYAGGDLWYEFTVPMGETQIDYTRSASVFSTTYYEVYSGSCGALVEEFCGTAASASFTDLTPGATYLLRLFDWGNNDFGDVTFCLGTPPPPPANDDCGTAIALNCGDELLGQTTVSSSDNGDDVGCASGNGVWYSFVGDGNEITVTIDPTFDAEIAIASSTDCTTFTNVVCRDGTGSGVVETVTFSSTVGTTYYIYIAYYQSGSIEGDFDISIDCNCANPPVATVTEGTNNCPTDEFFVDVDVTALGAATTVNVSANGTTYETGVGIGMYTVGPFAGNTDVNVIVSDAADMVCRDETDITVGSCPPVNDLCVDAIALSCGTISGTTLGANGASGTSCTGTINDNVWYSFVGDGNDYDLSVLGLDGFTVQIDVYESSDGTCDNITCNGASVDPLGGNPATTTLSTVDGTTYYIAIGYWSSSGTVEGDFEITLVCPPDNDLCADAQDISTEAANGGMVMGSTVNATDTDAPNDCAASPLGAGVWYSITNSGSEANINITCDAGNTIYVYEGTACSPTACAPNATGQGTNDVTFNTEGNAPSFVAANYAVYVAGASQDFTLNITNTAPLAVELTNFSGYAADKTNVLEWATANEVDAASFIVERSFNGRAAWQKVGTVAATNRSNSTSNYSLVDANPTAFAYYRLISTDVNGQSQASDVITIERKGEVDVQVYPVPAQDQVSVDFNGNDGESVNIYITDVAGRLVKQVQLDTTDGLNQVQVNISELADGIYFLTLDNGTAKATNRIVKQ